MIVVERAPAGEADLTAMMALSLAFPGDNLHTVDLPYRFSSWALDDPENARLWIGADGHLLAWAVLQAPFWTIDSAFHAEAESRLHRRVLEWADRRACHISTIPGGLPCWYVMAFADQAGRIHDLEAAGFASQADVGENSWSKVLMRRPAETPFRDCPLPPGFTIRPLAGEREVVAYVGLHRAVFESRSMTVEWRARTLRRPEYTPDLDLVAVDPGGSLAGFCIGWLSPVYEAQEARSAGASHDTRERSGRIEPLGVRRAFRGLGLGRALLIEALRRLSGPGSREVCLETDHYRDAALALYEALGFCTIRDVLVYRKDYAG